MTLEPIIRLLEPGDDLRELTDLLHRAYRRLADQGMNFTATDQTVEVTQERCAEGECWIAVQDRILGTITWSAEPDPHLEYYSRPGVAHFNQFAVDPSCTGRGLGDLLLSKAEARAKEAGFDILSLDTAEPAIGLIEYYLRRGYIKVGEHQWCGKSYRSIIMAKKL